MSARRQVRVAPSFFDRLDELLPAERTDSGTPSTGDFLFYELPPLMDALAEDHRSVTLAVEGLEQVRVLIAAGTTGSSPPSGSSKVSLQQARVTACSCSPPRQRPSPGV